jgi:hypothetical protein
MEIIKEALMQWGEAIHLSMENRTMFYSPVLDHWRVKKWAGKNAKSFIYDGGSFMMAFEYLLGTHAAEHPLQATGPGCPKCGSLLYKRGECPACLYGTPRA